jgi:ubiquinol-cytochrome c reductase cytochrome c subunit
MRLGTVLVAATATVALAAFALVHDAGAQSAGDAARGKAAFMKFGCYECHGTVGQGNLSAGPPLTPRPIPYANFLSYVRGPERDMPPYSARILPDAVAQDIYAYLSAVPAGPRADTIALLKGIGTGPALTGSLAHGRQVFVESCLRCHGASALGPNLENNKARMNLGETIEFIKNPHRNRRADGTVNPRPPIMPKLFPGTLSDQDVSDVAAYVQSL